MPPLTATTPSALRVDGLNLRDTEGNVVLLSGFNLGNWLLNEIWMVPIATVLAPTSYTGGATTVISDHVSLWRVAQERFGVEGRRRLQDAWRDAWLTEEDFARMRQAGFNAVRLPFIAENLLGDDPAQDPAMRAPADFTSSALGWQRLDQAIDWATAYGLYVVLVMHGAPGRQSVEHHTGQRGVNRLWTDGNAQRVTEAIWAAAAQHFAGNPAIAAFDLLNEPRALPQEQEDANAQQLHQMHDRLYRAIRAIDPTRVVVVEDGYSGFDRMPWPADKGWAHVVYSYHAYPESPDRLRHTLNDWEYADCRKRGVPFYLGEFSLAMSPGSFSWPDHLTAAVQEMTETGISWSAWNFKIVPSNAAWRGTHWGWYRNEGPVDPLDVWRDDLDTLVRKAGAFTTDRLQEDKAWRAVTAVR